LPITIKSPPSDPKLLNSITICESKRVKREPLEVLLNNSWFSEFSGMQQGIEFINSILFFSNQVKTSSKVCKLSLGCSYWSFIHAFTCRSFPFLNLLIDGSSILTIKFPKILYKNLLKTVLNLPYLLYRPTNM
jgi:hypothetical protein